LSLFDLPGLLKQTSPKVWARFWKFARRVDRNEWRRQWRLEELRRQELALKLKKKSAAVESQSH
jgi:hypothetical protein